MQSQVKGKEGDDFVTKRKADEWLAYATENAACGSSIVSGKRLRKNHNGKNCKGGRHDTKLFLSGICEQGGAAAGVGAANVRGTQFALAEQHSAAEDPVLLYAVENITAAAYCGADRAAARAVCGGVFPADHLGVYHQSMAGRLQSIFGKYMPDLELKDFYEMEIASASIMRGFMAMPCDVYFTMEAKISPLSGMLAQAVRCAAGAEKRACAAVLQMDCGAWQKIIQKTVAQAEEGFAALPAPQK